MSICLVNVWPTVTVENCSLPFTYNGQLYQQCVQTVTDCNAPCNKFACVIPGGDLAYCIPPTGNVTFLFPDITFCFYRHDNHNADLVMTLILRRVRNCRRCTCICTVHRSSKWKSLYFCPHLSSSSS